VGATSPGNEKKTIVHMSKKKEEFARWEGRGGNTNVIMMAGGLAGRGGKKTG